MGVGKRDLQWACALVCAVRSEDGRGQAGSPVGMRVGVRSEEGVRMGVGKRDLQWACALVCAVRSEDGRGQAGSPVGMRVGVRSE